jgi:hypothetical protein
MPKIDGKINMNSMLVYSGPESSNSYEHFYFNYSYHKYLSSHHKCYSYLHTIYYWNIDRKFERVACIFTGDANLNTTDISDIYHRYWEYVGTIQIPHHGDHKSFKSSVLKNQYYCCPISVGVNSHYKHPSINVMNKIKSHKSNPAIITEDLKSTYQENIEWKYTKY